MILSSVPVLCLLKYLNQVLDFFFLVYNEYFGGNFGGSFYLSKALTFFFFNFLHLLTDATLEVKFQHQHFPITLFYFSEAVVVKVVTNMC